MPVIWIFTVLGGAICLLFRYLRYWEAQYACYLDIYVIGRRNMPVIWIFTVLGGTKCLLYGYLRYWEAQYACYLDI